MQKRKGSRETFQVRPKSSLVPRMSVLLGGVAKSPPLELCRLAGCCTILHRAEGGQHSWSCCWRLGAGGCEAPVNFAQALFKQ